MWKSAAGHSVSKKVVAEADDWETDPDFENDISEQEQRWGAKTIEGSGRMEHISVAELRESVSREHQQGKEREMAQAPKASYGYGGKFGVEKDRMDKGAMGHDFVAKVEQHSSQTDAAHGFGGKFGVQKDRVDKSALGFEHKEELKQHASQKDGSKGFGGKYGVEKERVDRSALGYDYKGQTEKHESQKDYSKGFGGRYGVQSDRVDKSASSFTDMEEPSSAYTKTQPVEASNAGSGKLKARFENMAKASGEENKRRVEEERERRRAREEKERLETQRRQQKEREREEQEDKEQEEERQRLEQREREEQEDKEQEEERQRLEQKEREENEREEEEEEERKEEEIEEENEEEEEERVQEETEPREQEEQDREAAERQSYPPPLPGAVPRAGPLYAAPQPRSPCRAQEEAGSNEEEEPDYEEPPTEDFPDSAVPLPGPQRLDDEADYEDVGTPPPSLDSAEYEEITCSLTAKALYSYQEEADDEITFEVDDIITNIEMVDEGWWKGQCGGRSGLFPASYVQMLP